MGGKDAIVVDAECDLDGVVSGVVAAGFGYQGQKCSACRRAIVHEAVYGEFLRRLEPRVAALTVGDTTDPRFSMGPVISAGARKTILRYVDVGRAEGRLVAGGGESPGPGYFLPPPVLAVTKALDFDFALELANDSDYGLTGAVYCLVPEHLERAKAEINVGNLYLNRKCASAMVVAHPFGGFNLSGTDSKAGGPDYLLQLCK